MTRRRPRFAASLTAFASAACLVFAAAAPAEEKTFDFKDPKGVNGLVFVMDSELEPIVGMVGGVGGTVRYDPANPESFAGAITVDIAQIAFINPGMTAVLKGADWLGIEDQLIATMEFNSATALSDTEQGSTILEVESVLKFTGKEIPLTLTLEADHNPEAAAQRGGAKSGDLLVLRASFELSRLQLGIKEDAKQETVGPMINVIVPIVGYSQ
ncbi:MAG: YceI family protein [Planctomycetota bacterium]